MKNIIIALILVFGQTIIHCNNLHAQHQTFLGVELGKNPELFKYNLIQKGFRENSESNYEYLLGKYLNVDCRIWIKEENDISKHLVIDYRYGEDFSYEKAKVIFDGVVMKICQELQKYQIKYVLIEDVFVLGTIKGTTIWLENGYYSIWYDGSWRDLKHGWRIYIRLTDEPDNPIYKNIKR